MSMDTAMSPRATATLSVLALAFTAVPAAATIAYRAGPADAWHFYTSQFSITNDETIEYYGINISGVRSSLQTAIYSLGSPSATGLNTAFAVAPGSTNTPPSRAHSAGSQPCNIHVMAMHIAAELSRTPIHGFPRNFPTASAIP